MEREALFFNLKGLGFNLLIQRISPTMASDSIRLTQYSHGAGCGCKIAPDVLSEILGQREQTDPLANFHHLLVGNQSRDDAAAVDLGDGRALLSTTDFFMPIVDDPFDFGRIAATNAISDIYAMGGTPILAIAILGWPIDKLGPEIAAQVIDGGRQVCQALNIPLAGGHSIDAPEPIFGLAVNGLVPITRLKRNTSALAGDQLILTKPLGVGILTTAEKRGLLEPAHEGLATTTMCQSNQVGAELAGLEGVNALTDVTGFGLAGHLLELCEGAGLDATLHLGAIPLLDGLDRYLAVGCTPGGTARNFRSASAALGEVDERAKAILCDPQTSGGLLISATAKSVPAVQQLLASHQLASSVIGHLAATTGGTQRISLSAA